MGGSTKLLLQRLIRRIPYQMLQTMLGKWAHLSNADLHSLNFTQPKWVLTEHLLALCEEKGLTVKHITELEMIYIIENPNQGMWHGFQLLDAEEDAPSIELTQFKEQFKANLTELISHVSIKIKKHTDEAIWIRVAWGDNFTKPNHLKPTYVVHHLQTPYVFVTGMTSKDKPLLNQALVLATRYGSMKDAHLSGRNLIAIRDLLTRQYQQVGLGPVPYGPYKNPNIENEQPENTENRLQMACEAFGDGTLPQLQKAVYKLETKFRDNSNKTLTGRKEPFRGVVEFSSTNLLESLRHCVSSGMASTPVTPLLSSITQKGRNYFVITDKGV
uniref:Centromere protein N n=1 Tax=Oncorhynchus mykiss TaxID=8022 RepID=A0A8C7TZM0_ONCMY